MVARRVLAMRAMSGYLVVAVLLLLVKAVAARFHALRRPPARPGSSYARGDATERAAGAGSGRQGEDRVLTVPNALSALRLVCLPVFVVLLAQPHGKGRLAAAFLLAGPRPSPTCSTAISPGISTR